VTGGSDRLNSESPTFPVILDNWQTAAQIGWTFCHIAEIFPTALISRGSQAAAPLQRRIEPVAELPCREAGGRHRTSERSWPPPSKSIVGILGGALAGEGVLTLRSRSLRTCPLARSGYRGATLRHLLDMRLGIAFPRTTWIPTQRSGCSSKPSADPRRSPQVPNTLRELTVDTAPGQPAR
jgi:hypothetical protein